jgi:DNA repair protein RecO (recombination protein O)
LLEILSRDYGRVGLVARGARSARGRWRGQLQAFRPLLLSWSLRGELGTLTGLESRGAARAPGGRQVLSACYLNELLLRLLARHDPHPGLFAAYEQAIRGLDGNAEPVLRVFEMRLLQELGYGLLLDREADSGRPVAADALYEYRLERGPVRCDNARQEGLVLHGSSLIALHTGKLVDPLACREALRLLRAALSLYLGTRPLKTREVLRQLSVLTTTERRPVSRRHGD